MKYQKNISTIWPVSLQSLLASLTQSKTTRFLLETISFRINISFVVADTKQQPGNVSSEAGP